MPVTILEATTKSDFRQFVKIQFDIYKNNKYWVPPLQSDELKLLDAATAAVLAASKARFWLAFKNGQCAGRVGALINESYNEKKGEQLARFTRLEFKDDPEVAEALMASAEKWAVSNGMQGIHGPLGFTNLDAQGLLVEGFDQLPSIASSYHQPYFYQHLERMGYQKETDWLEFRLTVGKEAVDKANRGAMLVKKRYGIEILHFTNTKEILQYANEIFEILNDAFADLPYVSPISPEMAGFYVRKYIPLLNPEFVKIAKMKEQMVGFVIGLPSLSEAMQKAKGKLYPFGFYYLMQAKKGKDTLDQVLTGVKKEFQSTGAGVLLMAELQNVMLKKGMRYIETTGIFETNLPAIANWKNYEHIQHKRKRCYKKMF